MESQDKRDPLLHRRAEDAIRATAEGVRLSEAALALLGCTDEAAVYRVVGDYVSRLCPGSFVLVNEVFPGGGHMVTRAACGLDSGHLAKVTDFMGFDLVGQTWSTPPEAREALVGGSLIRLPGGFASLTLGAITPAAATRAAAAFGVVDLFAVGISDRTTTFGNIAILTRTPGATLPAPLIETFARHAFSAIENLRGLRNLHGSEAALRESERRYRVISETISSFVYSCRSLPGGPYQVDWMAGAVEELTGYTIEDVLARTCWRFMVFPGDEQVFDENVIGLAPGQQAEAEFRIVRRDGGIRWIRSVARVVAEEEGHLLFGACEDITARKEAEESLRESEAKYRTILQTAVEGFWMVDTRGHILEINDAYCRMSGYSADELLAMSISDLESNETDDDTAAHVEKIMEQGYHRFETRHIRKDGGLIDVEISAQYRPAGAGYVVAFIRDITDALRTDRELRLNATRMEALVQLNQLTEAPLQTATDFALENAVRLTDSTIGYLAFLSEDGATLTMHSWSRSAMAECAIADKPIMYPIGTTGLWGEPVRQRRPLITNDYQADIPLKKGFPHGHVALLRHLGVPIFDGDRIVAVIGVGNKADPYDDGDVRQLTLLMQGMWRMVSRADAAAEVVKQRDRAERALESVIEITRDIVDERDPYTSGHQRRVAEVAVRIAQDVGMSEHEIDLIRIAALLHDVGKVAIPSEILSKPGQISPTEYALLKSHADAGHRILVGAGLEEPLPDLVWQHHERCNGSGYPRGLTDAEILPGAKILAVADVLEAMTSHRPYRAALGIEAALAELEQGSGTLYDPATVGACVALFREQRFAFS